MFPIHCNPNDLPPCNLYWCQLIKSVMLPSFADVFALTETCTRFRRIWTTNLTAIYIEIAKRSIPCERHARVLLADQGGPPLNAPLSAEDMLRMVHNARVVQKAILQFEKEIVDRVQCKPMPQL